MPEEYLLDKICLTLYYAMGESFWYTDKYIPLSIKVSEEKDADIVILLSQFLATNK